jgi:hypothetical protein
MRSGIAIAPEHCENVSGIAGRAPRLWLYPSSAWRQMIEISTPEEQACADHADAFRSQTPMPRPRKRPIRRPGLTSTPASNASRSAATSSATVWNSPPLRWVCSASANSSQPRSAGRYGWRRGDGRQADDDQEADYYAHPAGTALGSLLGVLPGAGKFTSAASTSMTTSLGQEAGHRSRQLRASRPGRSLAREPAFICCGPGVRR